MILKQIICCAMLMSPMWSMAQVSDGLHVPTRSEVGPQAMPQTVAPVTAPFQFRLATIDRSKFEARQQTVKLKKGLSTKYKNAAKNRQTIQAAIDALSQQGGGTIVIPSGSDRPCKTDYRN